MTGLQPRPFVWGPYHPDGSLRLRPDRPPACPIGMIGVCRIVLKGFRSRSTGPGFPVQKALCLPHSKAFTIYPSGYDPYGRAPWIDAAPDGTISAGPGVSIFRAACDLARNIRWPALAAQSKGHLDTCGTSKTQERRIRLTCHFFGILPGQSDELREKSSACLGVPVMILRDAATKIRAGPALKNHAEAVVAVFQSVRPALNKVIAQRAQVGLWKPPKRSPSENDLEQASSSS
jgi:hypothetical protein